VKESLRTEIASLRRRASSLAAGLRRFLQEEAAEGTTSGGVRIALWVLAGLAVAGFVGVKVIYPMINKANACASAAASQTTAAFQGGTQAAC